MPTDLPMPMAGIKIKAACQHWAFMIVRAMPGTPDMVEQHKLLNCVANEVDDVKRNIPLQYFEISNQFEGLRGRRRVAHFHLHVGVALDVVDWRHS